MKTEKDRMIELALNEGFDVNKELAKFIKDWDKKLDPGKHYYKLMDNIDPDSNLSKQLRIFWKLIFDSGKQLENLSSNGSTTTIRGSFKRT